MAEHTLHCCVLICPRDTLHLCVPQVLFAMGVILLHHLPEGAAASTPASGNTYCLTDFITKKRSRSASDPERRQAAVRNSWPTLWHCPLPQLLYPKGWMKASTVSPPGCSSIAQGEVLVPPSRKFAVKRCTRLQRERKIEVESPVSPTVFSASDHTGPFRSFLPCRNLQFCHLKKMVLHVLLQTHETLLQAAW